MYRVNLGWLLGHRGLLLTHRGRKTGLLRQTVLGVIVYDPATRESVVLSGYGHRADWYRNITVEPALEAQTGRERYVPAQRFLTPQENVAAIAEYERRHPLAGRVFARIFDYRSAARKRRDETSRGRCAWWPSVRSHGTPRIANRLLRRVHDYAEVVGDGTREHFVPHKVVGLQSTSFRRQL